MNTQTPSRWGGNVPLARRLCLGTSRGCPNSWNALRAVLSEPPNGNGLDVTKHFDVDVRVLCC